MQDLQEKDVIYVHYRVWYLYLIIILSEIPLCMLALAAVLFEYRLKMFIFWVFGFVLVFSCLFDNILMVLNEKAIMTEEKIIVYNKFGIKREYQINEISQVVVLCEHSGNYSNHYIRIRSGKRKSKIYASPRGFDEFETELCNRLKLRGYSRRGKQVFDIKDGKVTRTGR